MFREDYDIYCTRLTWYLTEIPRKEANYFSEYNPNRGTKTLLNDYLLELPEISYKFVTNKLRGFKNTLSFESSDCDLMLETYSNNNFIRDYFQLFEKLTNQIVKYEIEIWKDDECIYKGIASRHTIEADMSNEDSSHEFSLQVLGFERELSEYFSNQPVIPYADLPWELHQGSSSLSLETIIGLNFNEKLTVNLATAQQGWYIMKDGHFYRHDNASASMFIRSGYARVTDNVYDYITKMLMGKGWTYFISFDSEGGNPAINVLSLNSSGTGTNEIEIETVRNPNIHFTDPESPVDSIFVNGCFFTGGDAAFPYGHIASKSDRGASAYIYTARHELAKLNHFQVCVVASGVQKYHLETYSEAYEYLRWSATDEDSYQYRINRKYFPGFTNRAPRENTLYIDAGTTDNLGYRVDLSNGTETPWDTSIPFNHYDLCYIGNYADMLFRDEYYLDPETEQLSVYSFDADMRNGNFFRNYAPLMNDIANNMLDIELDGIYRDMIKDIKFIKTSSRPVDTAKFDLDKLIDTTWALRELTINLQEDFTKLTLAQL